MIMANERKPIKAQWEQKHDIEENWKKATEFVPRPG
jgi:hypothetical protein